MSSINFISVCICANHRGIEISTDWYFVEIHQAYEKRKPQIHRFNTISESVAKISR